MEKRQIDARACLWPAGYCDTATPFAGTNYTFAHIGPRSLMDQVTMTYYDAGHMLYTHEPSRRKLRDDIVKFMATAPATTVVAEKEGSSSGDRRQETGVRRQITEVVRNRGLARLWGSNPGTGRVGSPFPHILCAFHAYITRRRELNADVRHFFLQVAAALLRATRPTGGGELRAQLCKPLRAAANWITFCIRSASKDTLGSRPPPRKTRSIFLA